jgi:hypothetical protein
METGTYFIVHPVTAEQENALIAFVKALKMDFTTTREKPYNPEFVSKIKKSKSDYNNGKGKNITIDELNSLWK